jgi:hypothetical protein
VGVDQVRRRAAWTSFILVYCTVYLEAVVHITCFFSQISGC